MNLSETLTKEIAAADASTVGTEPNVLMFVDNNSIFWVTKDDRYIWLSDHSGINEYIDDTHKVEARKSWAEDVNSEGVYWMNGGFESPFHISDFEKVIENINAIV